MFIIIQNPGVHSVGRTQHQWKFDLKAIYIRSMLLISYEMLCEMLCEMLPTRNKIIIHHLFFYIYRSVDVEEVYQSHHVVKMNVVQ